MAPITTAASRACLRAVASRVPTSSAPRAAALSTTAVRPAGDGSATTWTSYSSPFKGSETKAGSVPDFGKYVSGRSGETNKLFQYFMVGGLGAITAAGAKSTVQGGFLLIVPGCQLGCGMGFADEGIAVSGSWDMGGHMLTRM